jgi:hypothetical protein
MRGRVLARIREAAAPYLDSSETIRCAFYGQTGMPTGWAFMGAIARRVQFVIVAATDQNIYVFRRRMLQSPEILGLHSKYPIATSPEASFRAGAMRIGQDTYWVAALVSQRDARELVKYVMALRKGSSRP